MERDQNENSTSPPATVIEEWNGTSSTKLTKTATITATSSSSISIKRSSNAFTHISQRILQAFVPEGFPSSVTPDYVPFQVWDSLQGLSTYVRMMLSTQALLSAIGVGEKSATVIGATFQWFLRDLTGMVGGVLFTCYQGSNLDSNAKMWRLVADLMNDLGMLMDLVSPLFPSAFVFIVCSGSLSRSFTGVASGATRAALTQHFALQNNAADIAAKEGSQETLATMFGMALGMLLAHNNKTKVAEERSKAEFPFQSRTPDSKKMAEGLVLDTAIRDWVLIPLSVVMVLIGILRYFVSMLMRSSTQVPDPKIVKEGQVIIRARNLRAGANYIPAKSFRARKVYYGNEENGLLHVPKGQAQNPQAQIFSDPNMAMDMMKKNLSMIIPQTLTFAWVNFFFSGFVAAKIPFPLTQRFRAMLQNGIDLSTVDVNYVSSRSWYFLNLFGLRGLFSLILGEENATDDTQRMMQMSGFGFDPSKSLGAEKDGLDIIQHDWALPKFEQRAEAVLRKLVK